MKLKVFRGDLPGLSSWALIPMTIAFIRERQRESWDMHMLDEVIWIQSKNRTDVVKNQESQGMQTGARSGRKKKKKNGVSPRASAGSTAHTWNSDF